MKRRKRQAAPAAGSKEMPKRSMAHGKQRSKRKEGNPTKRFPYLMDVWKFFFGQCLSILCWIPDDSSSVHVAMWLLFDSLGKTSKSACKKDKIEAGQMEEYISHASLGWSLVLQVD